MVIETTTDALAQLATSAARLNFTTDQLTATVRDLEAAIKSLNLGIETWHTFYSQPNDGVRQIGYAKVNGKWGIALALKSWGKEIEEWGFGDAPRWLRVEAVDHIPALIGAMVTESELMVTQLEAGREKVISAAEIIGRVTGK